MSTEDGCGFDGELFMCIDGRVYGPCSHDACGGVCEYHGECECECHTADQHAARQAAQEASDA